MVKVDCMACNFGKENFSHLSVALGPSNIVIFLKFDLEALKKKIILYRVEQKLCCE